MIGSDSRIHRGNLPHLTSANKNYFVTFVTKERFILPEPARDIVLTHCIPRDHYFLNAAVVMPDHAHLIITPYDEVPLHEILQRIKGASAHGINRLLGRSGPVWQKESFDHIIRSNEKLDEKIAYVLDNPVRKGFVKHFSEWPWHYPTDYFPA